MRIKQSSDAQNNSDAEQLHPDGIQSVSGSQVVCAIASIEQDKNYQSDQSRLHIVMLSMSAVLTIVAVYLVFVLAL